MSSPSPLQNRVTPLGEIVAEPARGMFMGNRGGRLHDEHKRLGRSRWKSKAWIFCVLDFKTRRRELMGYSYTELFFLDEATAFAAGHRPCFECQRQKALSFANAWARAGGQSSRMMAAEMDKTLHKARLGEKPELSPTGLPDGTMILIAGSPFVIHQGKCLKWSHHGYTTPTPIPKTPVPVLTPFPTLRILQQGYSPVLHPTALAF